MLLEKIIKQKIREEGPMSFRDFMEMALYYPGLGYYSSPREPIGKNGDYYTSCNLTPVFGAMIARQLEEMYKVLDTTGGFNVIEYGGGSGMLCNHILDRLKENENLYQHLRYHVIEKNPVRLKIGAHKEKVRCHRSICDLTAVTGCILSNELVDNFPVHIVVMQEKLMEVFVDIKDGFVEVLRPAKKELEDYFSDLGVVLPYGFRTEVNLDARQWLSEVSKVLHNGYLLTIDYGYHSSELYASHRRKGTLVCYHQHKISYEPFTNIGKKDITSHVNFSSLCHWGVENGLDFVGYRNQGTFLSALGYGEHMKKNLAKNSNIYDYLREELRSKILLEEMGTRMKVLVQQKGVQKGELMGISKTVQPV
jgi:SAM-dependent MidA family methyltransferase